MTFFTVFVLTGPARPTAATADPANLRTLRTYSGGGIRAVGIAVGNVCVFFLGGVGDDKEKTNKKKKKTRYDDSRILYFYLLFL
jgi:hypothetical protein